jgi:hypothetical protein
MTKQEIQKAWQQVIDGLDCIGGCDKLKLLADEAFRSALCDIGIPAEERFIN